MIPQIMGILNVTPDSFSDGGRYVDLDAAVAHASRMAADGASIIDIGGESTRPGADVVPVDVELQRVVPVVEAVAALGVRVSVDTRRAEVATAAVEAGATLINDVSASLWPVAAASGAGWLAMHMAGEPATMQQSPSYDDVVAEVRDFLVERADHARRGGVADVWIDPGFGFGKSVEHNLALVAGIDALVATGYPVALGVSRKMTLGILTATADRTADRTTDRSADRTGVDTPAPPHERLEVGIALATWAMMAGARMIRVHDVRPHVEAASAVAAARHTTIAPIPAATAGR